MNIVGKKGNFDFAWIVSLIGAILIFVGIAWLIAWNWRSIPDFMRVIILILSTFCAFASGVFVRTKKQEGIARSLMALGGGFYILSVFLISQIYSTNVTLQGIAWLIFLCWPVLALLAYILDSKENLVTSMAVLGVWAFVQYFASMVNFRGSEEGVVFAIVILLFSLGMVLYAFTLLHNSLKHRFNSVYRFWTVLYFLAIFYILSFQMIQPVFGGFSFAGESFTGFLTFFLFMSVLTFIIGALVSVSKDPATIKKVLIFLAVIAVLFSLVWGIGAVSQTTGTCYMKSCYDYNTAPDCLNAPEARNCFWDDESSRCNAVYCGGHPYRVNESSCLTHLSGACSWDNDRSACVAPSEQLVLREQFGTSPNDVCSSDNNKKIDCTNRNDCRWRTQRWGNDISTSGWFMWLLSNVLFVFFIILILGYGKLVGSRSIVNLAFLVFILDIISRYVGFWMDLQGYLAFSMLAILGGVLLIAGAFLVPKYWKKNLKEVEGEEYGKQEAAD